MIRMSEPVLVYKGDAIASYGFGDPHPFGLDRHGFTVAQPVGLVQDNDAVTDDAHGKGFVAIVGPLSQ